MVAAVAVVGIDDRNYSCHDPELRTLGSKVGLSQTVSKVIINVQRD